MADAIVIKFHGPTNTKGSRYSATCDKERVVVARDYALSFDDQDKATLAAFLAKHPHRGTPDQYVEGTLPNGDTVFVRANTKD